jgi:pyridoxal phosphate enzyme (YggS family)
MTKESAIIQLDKVISRIEDARKRVSGHHIVKTIAVSKYQDEKAIRMLFEAGHRAFGENKVQDLAQKSANLDIFPLEWHMIGRLQKNKINQLITLNPFLFQSLDSLELARALHERLEREGKTMNTLLQINSAKEESKQGVLPEATLETYQQIQEEFPTIKLKGVMSIGAHTDDQKVIQQSFETTYKLYENLQSNGATICSMGMSSDFELAIESGSNMVRLGSILFQN